MILPGLADQQPAPITSVPPGRGRAREVRGRSSSGGGAVDSVVVNLCLTPAIRN
ncbi:hypothetical protein HBB16_17030, partial [Pseudonocardia sp. MCCB 268]|nr:hypothetical protein [Pseudonocardia cytotoxica]